MMKVLLVNGSPKLQGCTYTALAEIAATLQQQGIETEIFHIGTKPVSGCLACGSCGKTGRCVMDDAVNDIGQRIEDFDGFVFGTPVHYAAASGALTSFMDRLFYAYSKKMADKPAAAIASCRRGGASAAFDQLNKYFTISNMPIVSSQYWNQVHGNTPDEVKQDLEGMQTMRSLGKNMAWLIQCIAAGQAAGIAYPQREGVIRTNFIR